MGWCSGTDIFDIICEAMLNPENKSINPDTFVITSNTKSVLKKIIAELEEMDWDCQKESEFWKVPMIQEIFKELHPDWFDKQK